ncbi:MAG TPA: DUF5655 domain-containing protein [Bacteroidia bacterium]|nr:DUF5655 domain-containing protein [Bacteroidia bacterium]
MAKTPGDFEREFIATVKEVTGKTLEQWYDTIKASEKNKQMEIINWLKSEQKLNHLQAQLLTGLYLNGGKPVYTDEANLLDNQFVKREPMRPLYEAVAARITADFPGTQVIPKKTYVSFTAKREFAAINIKTRELRLGMDLGDLPFDGVLQKSKLTGPMPRISHMAVITDAGQLDELVKYLRQSYGRVNR